MTTDYQDYLDRVDARDRRGGLSEEYVRMRRAMLEANGEEYPGAYAGGDGWGPGGGAGYDD